MAEGGQVVGWVGGGVTVGEVGLTFLEGICLTQCPSTLPKEFQCGD